MLRSRQIRVPKNEPAIIAPCSPAGNEKGRFNPIPILNQPVKIPVSRLISTIGKMNICLFFKKLSFCIVSVTKVALNS